MCSSCQVDPAPIPSCWVPSMRRIHANGACFMGTMTVFLQAMAGIQTPGTLADAMAICMVEASATTRAPFLPSLMLQVSSCMSASSTSMWLCSSRVSKSLARNHCRLVCRSTSLCLAPSIPFWCATRTGSANGSHVSPSVCVA